MPPSANISSTVSVKGGLDNIFTADETLSQTWWAPQGGNLINTQKIMSAISNLLKEKLSFSTGLACYSLSVAGV